MVRKALQQGVRTSNHEVCRKTSLGTGIADNHPYNRVFLDADVNEGSKRRNDDHGRIGGNVADRSKKSNEKRYDIRRYILHTAAEHGNKHA